jgi:hypothetical protein
MNSTLIEMQCSFYGHSKDNKIPFPVTYYTIVSSIVMFSRSLKIGNLILCSSKCVISIFGKKNYACNYYSKCLQISSWSCNGIGLREAFYCEELFNV